MFDFLQRSWKGDSPRDHVMGFYKAMEPIHKALCKKWYYNIAMQAGNQWVQYQENSSVLQVPSAPPWRVHSVNNKILPLSVVQRIKLVPNNPTISTRPANMISEEDKNASDLARMWLRAKLKENDFKDELDEITLWMVPATMGYMFTLWDARIGEEIKDETGNGLGVGEGDIVQEAASPFEVINDYSVTRFKDMRRVLRMKIRSCEFVEYKYKVKVKPQKIDAETMYQIKAQMLVTGASNMTDIKKTMADHTIVYDMFEMPSNKYPDGFHHICTEDEDLITDPPQQTLNPYFMYDWKGRKKFFLPVDQAQMIRLAGVLVGTNSVEQAAAPQCQLNHGESNIQENIKRLGRTKVLAPRGKIVEGAMIEDPSEVVVEYDETIEGVITFEKPPEMASYHLNFIGSRPAAIQDSFGLHDQSMGVLPRRATSGKAIGFLSDADDERHTDPRKSIDRLIEGSARKMLALANNCYTDERVADLIGDDGKLVQQKISATMFRAIDVTITRDTALPTGAGDRMQLAKDILEMNPTREQLDIMFAFMEATDIEDLKGILQGNSMAEEIYVKMENYDLAKGIDRPVGTGENHQMHIKYHEKLLKNPTTKQDIKMLVMQHINNHREQDGLEAQQGIQNAQEAAIEAAAQGGAAGGQGPAAGAPGETAGAMPAAGAMPQIGMGPTNTGMN